jgi:transposase-like protein
VVRTGRSVYRLRKEKTDKTGVTADGRREVCGRGLHHMLSYRKERTDKVGVTTDGRREVCGRGLHHVLSFTGMKELTRLV